jgi:L-threonylcarbamoyladenylate synthase
VLKDLSGLVELVLDGGPTSGGIESTVLDLTESPPRILRPGLVTPEMLRSYCGPVDVLDRTAASAGAERSPGRVGRHYAPRVPLECTVERGEARVAAVAGQGADVGWLTLGPRETAAPSAPREMPPPPAPVEHRSGVLRRPARGKPVRPGRVLHLELPGDPTAYAAGLYAALHDFETAGVTRIVVQIPPDTEEWLAVRDRLLRAAVPPADQPL